MSNENSGMSRLISLGKQRLQVPCHEPAQVCDEKGKFYGGK